jgi:hypothetical protein
MHLKVVARAKMRAYSRQSCSCRLSDVAAVVQAFRVWDLGRDEWRACWALPRSRRSSWLGAS